MAVGKRVRFEVFKRDGFRCVYCGATPGASALHVDHVQPRAHGGSDDPRNLVTACIDCNFGKRDVPLTVPSAVEPSDLVIQVEMALFSARLVASIVQGLADGTDDPGSWIEHDFPMGLPPGFI